MADDKPSAPLTIDGETISRTPPAPDFTVLKPFWKSPEMAIYTAAPNQSWLLVTPKYYQDNVKLFQGLFLGWEKEDPSLRFEWSEHGEQRLLFCTFTPLALAQFLHNKGLLEHVEFTAIAALAQPRAPASMTRGPAPKARRD